MAKFRFRPEGLAKLRRAQSAATGSEPSDVDFAAALGVHRTTVYRVLSGEIPPGIPFLAGVVNAFGWDWLSDIVEVDTEEPAQVAS